MQCGVFETSSAYRQQTRAWYEYRPTCFVVNKYDTSTAAVPVYLMHYEVRSVPRPPARSIYQYTRMIWTPANMFFSWSIITAFAIRQTYKCGAWASTLITHKHSLKEENNEICTGVILFATRYYVILGIILRYADRGCQWLSVVIY